jgi:hypothetical protein
VSWHISVSEKIKVEIVSKASNTTLIFLSEMYNCNGIISPLPEAAHPIIPYLFNDESKRSERHSYQRIS